LTGSRRLPRRCGAVFLAVLVATPLLGSAAGATFPRGAGRAVEGVDRSRLLAPAGARVVEYQNAGYRLRWIGDEVHVEVDASPLASSSRFPEPSAEVPPAEERNAIFRLARALTTGAETHYEAVSRVLGWVARHVAYDADRRQPQEASAVLERRSGYCTGVARLTVALLEAVGIRAREVAGYVVGPGPGPGPGVSGYHRWIEAYLPDRGWVFSDPLTSHHYVPATYLRLDSEELFPDRGMEGLLIERHDGLSAVDLYPAGAPGVTARRNFERQLAATLHVRVEEESGGLAELTGGSRRRTHTLIDGETTFLGLDPGRYRLRLMVPGWGVVERSVELPGRMRKSLSLPAPARIGRGPGFDSPRSNDESRHPISGGSSP